MVQYDGIVVVGLDKREKRALSLVGEGNLDYGKHETWQEALFDAHYSQLVVEQTKL